MERILSTLIIVVLTSTCESLDVTVSSSDCGGTYTLSSGSDITLRYQGSPISECRYTITSSSFSKKICGSPERFSITDCGTKLEYHYGYYTQYTADKSYTCRQTQYSAHCTSLSTLIVQFEGDGSRTSDDIEIRLYQEDDELLSDVVDTVKTTVYVIIGVIVGVIVLVIIIVLVVVFVCCRRQRSQPGQVYRAQAQPAVVTTTYPMQAQGGYQPVQSGYQPPPQAGFQQPPPQAGFQQPPPQAGFQQPPPQAGFQQAPPAYQPYPDSKPEAYPPAPQQGYAGNQTAPFEKASAPPMGM